MNTQIWQHQTSGDRYAVALDSYQQLAGACGPLAEREIEQALTVNWDSNADDLGYVRAHQGEFNDVTAPHQQPRVHKVDLSGWL